MAFKINMSDFGKKENESDEELLPQIPPVDNEENAADEKPMEIAPQEDSEFALGDEIEDVVIKPDTKVTEVQTKKAFEGVNKDVLAVSFSPPVSEPEPESEIIVESLDSIPEVGLEIAEDSPELNEEKAKKNIIEREERKAYKLLEEEIAKGQQAANVVQKPSNSIKVIVIGGNEQYYKTVLTGLNSQYPDIDFIKYINVGGKNAFYTIDSLNPDIVFMYYNASIQNAIAFNEAVQTEVDDNGISYAKKYADKRLVVLAPNDFKYEMELREKGINYYVTENNTRNHTVDVPNLINVIRNAYSNIQEVKEQRLTTEQAKLKVMERQVEVPVEPVAPVVTPEPVTEVEKFVQQQGNTNFKEQAEKMPLIRQHREATVMPQEIAPHEIIGVYSATGGAGLTTFATNLASVLAKYSNIDQNSDYRVCLLEYNLVCQNIELFFNIKTDKNIAVMAKEVSDLYYDENEGIIKCSPEQMAPIISRYVYKEERTGLDILSGIQVPLEIDRLRKGFTNCLFNALREMYDVVIVDMSADIAKTPMLEAFNNTDKFYYIMPMDVPSIRNTRVLLKFLTGMFKKSADSIKIILNKVNVDNEEFGVDQVYKALASDNCVPEGTIPDLEHDVRSSINRGYPLVLEYPEHPISQAILSIAVGINPMINAGDVEQAQMEESGKKSSGLLGKLFGGKKKDTKNTTEHKKKKSSGGLFGKKKKVEETPTEEPTTEVKELPAPPKKKLFGDFGKKKQKQDDVLPDVTAEFATEEKQEKKGLLAKLFGGKKKKDKPVVTNKKKFGGFLNRGKSEEAPVVEQQADEPLPARPSRLRPAGRRPRR